MENTILEITKNDIKQPMINNESALKKCFSETRLNGLVLRNCLIKAATFEGKSAGGIVSQELTEFHRRIGEGGVGMTTLAYCAAENNGRIHENMLYMHEGIRAPLQHFIKTVQATGAKVSGQLSHCGGFSKNKMLEGARPLGPSWGLNMVGLAHGMFLCGALSVSQIKERVAAFGRAAVFMKSAGFDAIEIHFGHGYGLSQFISPVTNKRKDSYGGSLINRMRFPLEVLACVRKAVGGDFPLLGKISMTDGVHGGVSYDDSVEIAALLEAGGIDAIVCSGGTSSMNPMLLFRGDSLLPGLLEQEKSRLMKMGLRWMGPKLFRDYPYSEMYFLEQAKRIRARVQCAVCYIGGVCDNNSIATVMAEGFDFIELGRGLIFDPDFAKNAQVDSSYRNGCTHCNRCANLIEAPGGVRCVLMDAY